MHNNTEFKQEKDSSRDFSAVTSGCFVKFDKKTFVGPIHTYEDTQASEIQKRHSQTVYHNHVPGGYNQGVANCELDVVAYVYTFIVSL